MYIYIYVYVYVYVCVYIYIYIKGWNPQVLGELPGKLESSNISRDNLRCVSSSNVHKYRSITIISTTFTVVIYEFQKHNDYLRLLVGGGLGAYLNRNI